MFFLKNTHTYTGSLSLFWCAIKWLCIKNQKNTMQAIFRMQQNLPPGAEFSCGVAVHNPIMHCSVIAVAWSNQRSRRIQLRILQPQTVTAVTLRSGRQLQTLRTEATISTSTKFWTPEAILISRRSFSFPSATSSRATAVIRHSQTTSSTSSCSSLNSGSAFTDVVVSGKSAPAGPSIFRARDTTGVTPPMLRRMTWNVKTSTKTTDSDPIMAYCKPAVGFWVASPSLIWFLGK